MMQSDLAAVARALLQYPQWRVKIRDGRRSELSVVGRGAMATPG
jgi:hypothetical protein